MPVLTTSKNPNIVDAFRRLHQRSTLSVEPNDDTRTQPVELHIPCTLHHWERFPPNPCRNSRVYPTTLDVASSKSLLRYARSSETNHGPSTPFRTLPAIRNTKNTQNELFMAIDETKKKTVRSKAKVSKTKKIFMTSLHQEVQVRSAADVNHAVDKNCFLLKPSRSFTKGEGPRHARPRAKRHLRGAWRIHGGDSDPDPPDHLSFARQ